MAPNNLRQRPCHIRITIYKQTKTLATELESGLHFLLAQTQSHSITLSL